MAQKRFFIMTAAVLAAGMLSVECARGQNAVNEALVRSELYVWNRLADMMEIVRGGVALGPAAGAELAITRYAQLGAYVSNEHGASFPHFIPPLWLVTWLDKEDVFTVHKGTYYTYSFGPYRSESSLMEDIRFERAPWDIRAQVAVGLAHLYLAIDADETIDFLAGIGGFDPLEDDEGLDPQAEREPALQLGRGLTNIATGIFEVPKTMHVVNQEYGGFAGLTTGFFSGVWRFGIREAVGVLEVVTFPMGWEPIVEPAFPYQPAASTEWKVNTPAFMKEY